MYKHHLKKQTAITFFYSQHPLAYHSLGIPALKKKWVNFIFSRNVPTQLPKVLYGPNISQMNVSSTWANTELASMSIWK